MPRKSTIVVCAELVMELDTLTTALGLACAEEPDNLNLKRSLFKDLLALVTDSESLWAKNLRLSTAALATVHLFVSKLPAAEQTILHSLFDPSTNMIGPLSKLVQATVKQHKAGKRGRFKDNSAFFMHKVAKEEHTCADFNICVLRAVGLCSLYQPGAKPSDEQMEYIYHKDKEGLCLHLHTQCYYKHVMNEEWLQDVWSVKSIEFRTPELYHVITIGDRVQCCACRAVVPIKLEPDESGPDHQLSLTTFIQGTTAMLYYASVSVNRHVLCVSCFTNLQQTPNVHQCIHCYSYANPTAVVAHVHGSGSQRKAELAAVSAP